MGGTRHEGGFVSNVNKEFNKDGSLNGPIPDIEGAPTGLSGVKSPASYRQQGDIEDRMRATPGVAEFLRQKLGG